MVVARHRLLALALGLLAAAALLVASGTRP